MVVPLHMGWRHALFANWPIDPAVIEPHVPDRLSLDTFEGHGWLSIVPFTNVDVRPRLVPEGFGLPLPEINRRTYVSCNNTPGVYFFNLDAHGILAVIGARLFHHLPYYYANGQLTRTNQGIRFTSRRRHPGARPAHFDGTYAPIGSQFFAESDPTAQFLVERYRYYTEAHDGTIRYADVEHDPWPLYEARADIEANTLFAANRFATPDSEPVYLYSPGVDTTASKSKRIDG